MIHQEITSDERPFYAPMSPGLGRADSCLLMLGVSIRPKEVKGVANWRVLSPAAITGSCYQWVVLRVLKSIPLDIPPFI